VSVSFVPWVPADVDVNRAQCGSMWDFSCVIPREPIEILLKEGLSSVVRDVVMVRVVRGPLAERG